MVHTCNIYSLDARVCGSCHRLARRWPWYLKQAFVQRGMKIHSSFRLGLIVPQSCTQLPNGSYTKDLSVIEQDLSRVCLVDNSPVSYNVNPGTYPLSTRDHSLKRRPANGIPIEGWISDPSDEALLHLLPVLDSLRFATDVRRILGLRLFN